MGVKVWDSIYHLGTEQNVNKHSLSPGQAEKIRHQLRRQLQHNTTTETDHQTPATLHWVLHLHLTSEK